MAVNVTEGNSISGNTVKFSSYALRKCLIGFGAVNGVLNAVIFWFMHSGDMTVQFDFVGIVADLAITGLILGAILFACAVPLTKRDMRAGAFVSPETFGGVAGVVPRSYGVAMLVVAVVAGTFMGLLGIVAASALSAPISAATMMALKGCACAFGGAAAGYLSLVFTARSFGGR